MCRFEHTIEEWRKLWRKWANVNRRMAHINHEIKTRSGFTKFSADMWREKNQKKLRNARRRLKTVLAARERIERLLLGPEDPWEKQIPEIVDKCIAQVRAEAKELA